MKVRITEDEYIRFSMEPLSPSESFHPDDEYSVREVPDTLWAAYQALEIIDGEIQRQLDGLLHPSP